MGSQRGDPTHQPDATIRWWRNERLLIQRHVRLQRTLRHGAGLMGTVGDVSLKAIRGLTVFGDMCLRGDRGNTELGHDGTLQTHRTRSAPQAPTHWMPFWVRGCA